MYKTKCFNSLENLFGGRIIPKFYIFTNVCWLWIKPLLLCSMSCQDDHRWLIRQSVGFLRASWSHEMTELLLLRSIESPWFSLFLVQFSSVAQSCPTLCDPMDCSMPGLPVHHQPQSSLRLTSISRWCHPTISPSGVFTLPKAFSNLLAYSTYLNILIVNFLFQLNQVEVDIGYL